VEEAFEASLERLKQRTRRYSRKQRQWLKNRLFTRAAAGADGEGGWSIVRLDSSNYEGGKWPDEVRAPALTALAAFLSGGAAAVPPELRVRNAVVEEEQEWRKFTCEVCGGRVLNGQHEWGAHLKSRSHRAKVKKARKRSEKAALATEQPQVGEE